MRATTISTVSENDLAIDTPTLMAMLHCGRVTAVEIGKKATAEIRVGRRVLWNVDKVKRYLESISE